MAKVIVKVLEIECLHKSAELDKFDEVYCFVQYFTASNKNGSVALGDVAGVKVSDIKQQVQRGSKWIPNPSEFTFELRSNTAFGLAFSIGEGDNKKLYTDLRNGKLNTEIANFKWGELATNLVNDSPNIVQQVATSGGNVMNIGNLFINIFRQIFEGGRKDDVFGTKEFGYALSAGTAMQPVRHEFEFKRAVAHYRAVVEISTDGAPEVQKETPPTPPNNGGGSNNDRTGIIA